MRFAVDVKPAVSFEEILPPDLSAEAIDDDEPAASFGELLQPDIYECRSKICGAWMVCATNRSRVSSPLRSTKKLNEY